MWRFLIGALMLAYCLPAAFVPLWPDTVRDLASSLALARGEAIPLLGPGPINHGPYAGPAWIYLQAPPLVFFPTLVAASIYVAIVASLKFPALYELGRRLSGPRLGVCMAAAAAFPSFAVYQWIMFFHPNWVELMITITLIVLLVADRRRSLKALYGAALMLGLAVQIHTTALFYFPLLAFVLYRIGTRGFKLIAHLAVMLFLIALWFAPTLFAPAADRGAIEGAAQRISSDMTGFNLLAVATAIRTAFYDFPLAIGETYAAAVNVPSWLWVGGLCVIGLAIGVGALLRLQVREDRRSFIAAIVLLLAAWTIAVAVRSFTSFYLVYFLLPLVALVIGLSLEATMSSRFRALQATGGIAVLLLVVSLFAAAYGARSVGRSAFLDSPILAMGDLAHPAKANVRAPFITAASRDAVAREACAMSGPVFLHGELASATGLSMGLEFRMHCHGSLERFAMFGTSAGTHLAALPEPVAAQLALSHGKPARGLRLLENVRPIHPAEPRNFEKRFHYFEQVLDRKPVQRLSVQFDAQPNELVAVYRHKPLDSVWKGFAVRQGESEARPEFTTVNSWIYKVGESPGRWTVEVETDAPQWVEVLAIRR